VANARVRLFHRWFFGWFGISGQGQTQAQAEKKGCQASKIGFSHVLLLVIKNRAVIQGNPRVRITVG
jgi:hypothetical protein